MSPVELRRCSHCTLQPINVKQLY